MDIVTKVASLLESSRRALHELEVENCDHSSVTYPSFWGCEKSTEDVINELREAIRPFDQLSHTITTDQHLK